MSMQTWQETLIAAATDGTALSNSTAETSIAPGDSKILIPSNFFSRPGSSLLLKAVGRISTVVTTPGTLTFKVKLGPTANIAVAASQALTLTTTAQTNVTWYLEWLLTLRAVGASTSANFMHGATFNSSALNNSQTTPGQVLIPATTPAVGTGFDSTVANQFDLTATWSVASASNSIQTHMLMLSSLN